MIHSINPMKYIRFITFLFAPLALPAAEAPAKKFNILHIHADDHRADCLGALGNPVVKTPNLDQLAARGLTFTHCYTMGSLIGAVCLPSRTMMLTGKSWQRIPAKGASSPSTSTAKALRQTGYQTWHCGKGGNEYTAGLKDFDTSLIIDDHGPELRRGTSERHADAAIKFLHSRQAGQPFYIYLAPPVPHDPRAAAPEFHKMYDPAKIPLPPAFLPQHPFNNGDMSVRDEMLAPFPRTQANTQQQLADYYACVTGLDHHVGRIFEQLKQSGQWENTIILFTGDNGLSLGDHGLFGKQNLYEFGGMHVPFIIAGPGIRQGKTDALVYLMDLFPTLIEIGGASLPQDIDGQSLTPILNGTQTKVRELLYTGYKDCQRSIRDDRWKLIRYPLVNRTFFYDLQEDPHELTNIVENREHAVRVSRMMEQLQAEMKRYGDKTPLTVA